MKFKFKISNKIKEAWELYKQNIGLFLLMLAILFVLQVVASRRDFIFYVISIIFSIFFGYMIKRFLLSIIDKKEFDPFSKKSLPSFKMLLNFVNTYLLCTLIAIGGILIFVLPTSYVVFSSGVIYGAPLLIALFVVIILIEIYLSIRLSFALYLSVDKNQGAKASIKESWNMTKDNFFNIFGKMIVIGIFGIIGLLAFGVGFLITYPLSMIVMAMLYKDLKKFKEGGIISIIENKIEEVKEIVEEKVEEIKEKVEEAIN